MLRTEIKYGLILGSGICVYTVVAHLLGFYTNNIRAGKYGDVVIILLPIAVFFLAIREKWKRMDSLTVFEGIRIGLLVALVSFPISTAFLWVYHAYVNPNWLEFILAYERDQMMQAGIGAGDINARIERVRAGNSGFAQIVSAFVGAIVLGLLLSTIFSLVLRKRRDSGLRNDELTDAF